jgi:hypothetical protein
VRRQAALAAVALLAALAAIALGNAGDGESSPSPPVAPPASAEWKEAVAGVIAPRQYGRETACGIVLAPEIHGVAHPVLPCGVDLLISYEGEEVRTEVIDRGPRSGPAREFDLTEALADELGLADDLSVEGTQTIRWRFAG